MAFELPFPPFPHDSRDVPFIATPDDNNGYAVPSSQYFKKLVGEKHLWTPVSSDDPMPSSDVAAQAQLAEILAKLSADPATQTTLAAILAKIIAAPATEAKQDTIIGHVDGVESALASILEKLIAAPSTEAKQDALAALIGEVQASPTANTLLARLKSLEDKIDAITDGTSPAVTQLTGSYVEIGGVSFAVSGGDTLRGKFADKPDAVAAHAVIPFCYYFSVDTGIVEVTDGTNWVVI